MAEFSEQEATQLLEAIFSGSVSVTNLPRGIFQKIREALVGTVHQGFGSKPDELGPGTKKKELLDKLDGNIKIFSAAKTFQQVREMSAQVTDGAGNKRSWTEFKDIAGQVFDKYNKNWLKTEQNTAFNGSKMAEQWRRIEQNKDLYPMLEYRTVGDSRVRDEHENLEGTRRPVDDSFWDRYMPPNGHNCRCPKPKQVRSGPSTDIRGLEEPPDLFKMNPGKDGFIFKEDVGDGIEHPYFRVDQRYEVLKEQGFGLV